MVSSILCFVWSFLVSVFAIPSIINVAHIKQLLDEPNMRTIHVSLTPRLGGIAIFAGLVSAYTIFGDFTKEIQQVFAGCIILFFIGLKDDIITLSTFKKFFVQVLAAGIVIFIGDIRISNFHGFLGWYELPYGISYAFTMFVIIGITNAVNLIDGLDGLAGSITIVTTGIFCYFFLVLGNGTSEYFGNIGLALIGGVLGFLRYNFNKAIIFMGDTGSLICGFLLSIFAVKFIQIDFVPSSPVTVASILIIPVFDTLRVFLIRVLNGKSPFSPDRNHIHHILKEKNIPQKTIVVLICLVNLLIFLTLYFLNFLDINFLASILAGICILFFFFFEWYRKS